MGGLDQLPVFGSSPTAATGSGGLLSSEVREGVQTSRAFYRLVDFFQQQALNG